MRHLFIINPKAGKRKSTQRLLEQIQREFEGREYTVSVTGGPGEGERLARQAAQSGQDVRIYACGGDGTLNEVVNGAAGWPNAAVTNVPKGTGNDFLKIFGKEKVRQFADLAALADGPQAAMDLIECGGRLGINGVCAGVDARVAADVHRYKRLPLVTGLGAYVLSLIVNVLRGLTQPARVTMGEKCMEGETAIICVCNGRYYGGGFMPVGDAEPDDGVLDVLVVPKISLFTFARLVGKYAKGRYREYPHIITAYHGGGISFSSPEELTVVVDGEVLRGKSFTARISEKKVNFFYPRGLTYHVSGLREQAAAGR